MWSGICVWLLGWNSKGPARGPQEVQLKGLKGTGFSADRASEPTPAEGAPFEVLLGHPVLTAQMTDDTYQALRFYTPKQTKRRSECQSLSERENVQNVQWQGTRKESVEPDFDLVTVTAYRNVSTPVHGLYNQTLISSVASHDTPSTFALKTFCWNVLGGSYIILQILWSYGTGWAADKSFTTSAWVHTANFVLHLLSERWLNAQRHSGRIPNISQSNFFVLILFRWHIYHMAEAFVGVRTVWSNIMSCLCLFLYSISNTLVTLLLVNKSPKLMRHMLSMY